MMDHEPLSKHQKGPKACATCAKAKSRCISGPVDGICERCHRLNKTCSSQVPAPPRKRKEPRPTRVAELEKRLQDLTARIETTLPLTPSDSGASGGGTRPPPQMRSAKTIPFDHLFPNDFADKIVEPQKTVPQDFSECRLRPLSPDVSPSSQCPLQERSGWDSQWPAGARSREDRLRAELSWDPWWPRGEEAEQMLEDYKIHMAPLFPFVVVPPHMTSDELRKQRPFLWRGVIMQACHLDCARQIALGQELLKDIAQASLLKPEKSLDLLQGLEILIAWFHYNLHSFQLTNLLFLARSICVSLGFNESQDGTRLQEHTSYCLEQMRAFAGCYYLVTLVFTTNKKPDAFMNTSYLEACCRVIGEKMECSTDEFLIYLVKIQQLAQSISMTLAFRNNSSLQVDLPVTIIIKSFQQQLESFKNSVPISLADKSPIKAHYHIAEMLLYEIGIQDVQTTASLSPTDRLELLWSCVNATKSFLDIRFSEPLTVYPRFICMASFDFVYSLILCLKLMTLNAPGWDLNTVRKQLCFDELVARQARDLRVLAERRSKGSGSGTWGAALADPFLRLATRLEQFNEVLRAELGNVPEVSKMTPVEALAQTSQDFVQDLDSGFWQAMFTMNPTENLQATTDTPWPY